MPGVQTGEISLQQEEVLHESRYAAAALILVLAAPVFICAILQRRKFHARWRAECGAGPYREIIEYNVACRRFGVGSQEKTTELTSLERAQDWPPIKSREKRPRRASAGMEGTVAYASPFARGHHTGEEPTLALGVSKPRIPQVFIGGVISPELGFQKIQPFLHHEKSWELGRGFLINPEINFLCRFPSIRDLRFEFSTLDS